MALHSLVGPWLSVPRLQACLSPARTEISFKGTAPDRGRPGFCQACWRPDCPWDQMEKEDSKLQSQTCSLPVADGSTELGVLPVLSGMNEKKKNLSRFRGLLVCAPGLLRCEETSCRLLGEPGTPLPDSGCVGTRHSPHGSSRLEWQLRPLVLDP